MTVGYRNVCEAKTKRDMLARFETLLKELAEREGGTPEFYRAIQLSNVGYFSGYYDQATAKRVLKWLNAKHPIFGTAHADGTVTADAALNAGRTLAKARARKA